MARPQLVTREFNFRGERRSWGFYPTSGATRGRLNLHGAGGTHRNTLTKVDEDPTFFDFGWTALKMPDPRAPDDRSKDKRKHRIPNHVNHQTFPNLWEDVEMLPTVVQMARDEHGFDELFIQGHSNGAKFVADLCLHLFSKRIELPDGVLLKGAHFSDLALLKAQDFTGYNICPLVMSWGSKDSNTTEPAEEWRFNSVDGARDIAAKLNVNIMSPPVVVLEDGRLTVRESIGNNSRFGELSDNRGHSFDKHISRLATELLEGLGETYKWEDPPGPDPKPEPPRGGKIKTTKMQLGVIAGIERTMAADLRNAATADRIVIGAHASGKVSGASIFRGIWSQRRDVYVAVDGRDHPDGSKGHEPWQLHDESTGDREAFARAVTIALNAIRKEQGTATHAVAKAIGHSRGGQFIAWCTEREPNALHPDVWLQGAVVTGDRFERALDSYDGDNPWIPNQEIALVAGYGEQDARQPIDAMMVFHNRCRELYGLDVTARTLVAEKWGTFVLDLYKFVYGYPSPLRCYVLDGEDPGATHDKLEDIFTLADEHIEEHAQRLDEQETEEIDPAVRQLSPRLLARLVAMMRLRSKWKR